MSEILKRKIKGWALIILVARNRLEQTKWDEDDILTAFHKFSDANMADWKYDATYDYNKLGGIE